MNEYAGTVTTVTDRKWGDKTLYSFKVKGSDVWFRTEIAAVVEGETIRFKGAKPTTITEINTCSEDYVVELNDAAPSTVQGASVSASAAAPPTNSPDYWRWKQMVDLENQDQFLWRDARADATRIICAALDNDVIALGAAKGKKLDILVAQIAEVTRTLVTDYKERGNESGSDN